MSSLRESRTRVLRLPLDRSQLRVSPRVGLIAGLVLFSFLYALLPTNQPYELGTIASWLASIALFLLIVSPADRPWPALSARRAFSWRAFWPPRLSWHGALLFGVLALALVLRLVNLENVPPLIHGDEGEMGVDALNIALGIPPISRFFGTGWFEHPSLHYYLEALSIRVFGISIFALRFVTAIWGVIGVLATYLAGRSLLSPRAGLLAAAIAASAPVDLQLSRISLNNVETVVLGTFAIYFAVRAVNRLVQVDAGETEDTFWSTGVAFLFAVAGVAVGLSMYFYFASRLIPVLLGIIFVYALVCYRRHWSLIVRGSVLAFVGFLIVLLPLLLFYLQNPQANGTGRFGSYLVFTQLPQVQQAMGLPHPLLVFPVLLRDAVGQFFWRPDGSNFFAFGAPILLAPVAALFALGNVLALVTLKRFSSFVLLLWFWLTLIVGNVLMREAPYTPRIVGTLPAVYILAALSLDFFLRQVEAYLPRNRRALPALAAAVLLTGITVTGVQNYFVHYFARDPYPVPTALARFVDSLPSEAHVYNLPENHFIRYGPIRYLAHEVAAEDLPNPPESLPTLEPTGNPVAFVVFPKWQNLLPAIQEKYPGGETQTVTGYEGRTLFTTYTVEVPPS